MKWIGWSAMVGLAGSAIAQPFWMGMASAQIVPDGTVGTLVTQDGIQLQIDGGTMAGTNLFHSFAEFSVPAGGEAFFRNGGAIENIFSRVTGENASRIDGLIRANGTANLFLLNPNGISFGPNVQLNLGGSFFGTTAERVLFEDGSTFDATAATAAPPLLTVSIPVGLGFRESSGAIAIDDSGLAVPRFESLSPQEAALAEATFQRNFLADPNGLRVEPNRTLALVGNGLAIAGGQLKASAGRIELGSAAGSQTVRLLPTASGFALDYEADGQFGDIRISGHSALVTSGTEGGGAIQLQGETIDISGASSIFADTLDTGSSFGVSIRADRLNLREGSIVTSGTISTRGSDAGDIRIRTGSLTAIEGSQLITSTFGEGNAGTISIEAKDTVIFSGASPDGMFPSGAFSTVQPGGRGNAGGRHRHDRFRGFARRCRTVFERPRRRQRRHGEDRSHRYRCFVWREQRAQPSESRRTRKCRQRDRRC